MIFLPEGTVKVRNGMQHRLPEKTEVYLGARVRRIFLWLKQLLFSLGMKSILKFFNTISNKQVI
jgi:hypothetical protein